MAKYLLLKEQSEITHEWVLEEPLIFNPLLSGVILKSKGVYTSLVRAGICKMCHLRSMDQWISAENMAMKIGIHSVRTV